MRLSYSAVLIDCDEMRPARSGRSALAKATASHTSPRTRICLESFCCAASRGGCRSHQLPSYSRRFRLHHQPQWRADACAHTATISGGRQCQAATGRRDPFRGARGCARGMEDYEALVAAAAPFQLASASVDETDLLHDQLHEPHDVTTERRHDHAPKRVHERHRHAAGLPMRMTDRYLWTLPMFHANGWTYTWIVTAAGATHVCPAARSIPPACSTRFERADHHARGGPDCPDLGWRDAPAESAPTCPTAFAS